jgi:hypothetical protein
MRIEGDLNKQGMNVGCTKKRFYTAMMHVYVYETLAYGITYVATFNRTRYIFSAYFCIAICRIHGITIHGKFFVIIQLTYTYIRFHYFCKLLRDFDKFHQACKIIAAKYFRISHVI